MKYRQGVLLFWVLVPVFTQAQTLDAGAEAREKHWLSGETELGYIYESGNTNESQLNFKQVFKADLDKWQNTLTIKAENSLTRVETTNAQGKTVEEDKRTAEEYFVAEQLDYFFVPATYGFLRYVWEKDRFSGFDHESMGIFGVGHSFYEEEARTLKFELGVGHRALEWDENLMEEDPQNPGGPDILALRAGNTEYDTVIYFSNTFVYQISEPVEFGQGMSLEAGEANKIGRFDTYIKSALFKSLAMKVAYELKYTDEVADDKAKTDKTLTVSIAYAF